MEKLKVVSKDYTTVELMADLKEKCLEKMLAALMEFELAT
jgi:hypothetical protein